MKEWLEFLHKPSWIGLAALAILGVLYIVRLALDFFKGTILPRLYEARLKRHQLSLPTADKVLDSSKISAVFFRDGDPKHADFKAGCVFTRPELNAVRTAFHTSRYVYIQGPPSSGKSVIGLHMAFQAMETKRTALYFDRPSLVTDDLLIFIATDGGVRFLDSKHNLIIIDDVHLDVPRVSRLFDLIHTKYANAQLLFISRPVQKNEFEADGTNFYDFTRYMTRVEIQADAVIEPLADFYSRQRFGHGIPPTILKAFTEECGNDLLLLGRYLREWDGASSTSLPNIRKKVIQAVHRDIERLRALSPDAVKALIIVSQFYRYEIALERAFLETYLGLQIAPLLFRGELKEQNAFILLYHSSLAKLYSNVCSTLRMPEYEALRNEFTPFPEALLKKYIDSKPRNICEFIIGARKFPRGGLAPILQQHELHANLTNGLQLETDLNYLGWAILIIARADRKNGLSIIKNLDLSPFARDLENMASPDMIKVFLINLKRVSKRKGVEFLNQCNPSVMARAIESTDLGTVGSLVGLLDFFSNEYFIRVSNLLNPERICHLVLIESDPLALRQGLYRLAKCLGDRICIKASTTEDAFGERLHKLTFYFDTNKTTRFLRGKRLEIPYGASPARWQAYNTMLYRRCQSDCAVILDDGASVAFQKGCSIFSVGVARVVGSFKRNEVISIRNSADEKIGFGVTNFTSIELHKIKGLSSQQIAQAGFTEINRIMDKDLTFFGSRMQNIGREANRSR